MTERIVLTLVASRFCGLLILPFLLILYRFPISLFLQKVFGLTYPRPRLFSTTVLSSVLTGSFDSVHVFCHYQEKISSYLASCTSLSSSIRELCWIQYSSITHFKPLDHTVGSVYCLFILDLGKWGLYMNPNSSYMLDGRTYTSFEGVYYYYYYY